NAARAGEKEIDEKRGGWGRDRGELRPHTQPGLKWQLARKHQPKPRQDNMAGRGGACDASRERGPDHRGTRDGISGTMARAAKADGALITSARTRPAPPRRPRPTGRRSLPIPSPHPAPPPPPPPP